jgi:hypothetical protein
LAHHPQCELDRCRAAVVFGKSACFTLRVSGGVSCSILDGKSQLCKSQRHSRLGLPAARRADQSKEPLFFRVTEAVAQAVIQFVDFGRTAKKGRIFAIVSFLKRG